MPKKEISFRPGAGTGSWLSTLLPIAVVLGAYKYPNSSKHNAYSGIFSLGLLATQAIVTCVHYTFPHTLLSSRKLNIYLIAPVVLTSLLLSVNEYPLSVGIVAGFLSTYGYTYSIGKLLAACPCSLTYGEASIVTQAILLFLFNLANNLHYVWYFTPTESIAISTLILQIGLLAIGVVCAIVYYVPILRSTLSFYITSVTILGCGMLPLLHYLLHTSPLLWIIQFVFEHWARIGLATYWLICSCIAVIAVASQIEGKQKASTVVRKYFHILAIVVFIPGIVQDFCFLYLASGVVLGLFIVLETVRVLQVSPLGEILQEGFFAFADEKDQGGLSLTPIYLLTGCSLPLWLHPEPDSNVLTLLAGVLSIGIGDACASMFGTWFGTHKWSGASCKSLEGSFACAFSQLLVIYLFYLQGITFSWIQIVAAILVTTLTEALTDQVDNLVLPLVMYILLL